MTRLFQRLWAAALCLLLAAGAAMAQQSAPPPGEYDRKILREKKILKDAELHAYVSEIIARVNEGRPSTAGVITLHLIDENVPNAFTTGNGYVYVYTGLIRLMQNEAQLAMVMGHELAHDDLKHVDSARKAHTAGAVLSRGGIGSKVLAKAGISLHSRMQERMADLSGLKYVAAGGYDTSAAAQAFARLGETSPGAGPGMWTRSHPLSAERHFVLSRVSRRIPGGDRVGEDEYLRRAIQRLR